MATIIPGSLHPSHQGCIELPQIHLAYEPGQVTLAQPIPHGRRPLGAPVLSFAREDSAGLGHGL